MCQLFAMNSNRPEPVHTALAVFTDRGGRTGDHVDGWGIAFHAGAHSRVFLDPGQAANSALASYLTQHPIRATTVLAHVRKATHGKPAKENCHPFQRLWRGRRWSFSHNGKLLDFKPALRGPYHPAGETDSEHAFCWILEQLNLRLARGHNPSWRRIAPVLAELATEVGQHGEFNFTLTDGRALYALGATRLAWTCAQHGPAPPRTVHVATVPLTPDPHWKAFDAGELKVFSRGRQVWSRRLSLPIPAPHASSPGT